MKKILIALLISILSISIGISSLAAEGWNQDNTGWRYENPNGTHTKEGWQHVNDSWYYFEDNGYMKTGWLYLGSTWYFLREDGVMHTGWYLYKDTWYFFNSSGAMHRGWLDYSGKWYYLHSTGPMAFSTTIDGYIINTDGVWVSSSNTGNNEGSAVGSKYPLQLDYNNARSYEDIDNLAKQYNSKYKSEIKVLFEEINKIRISVGAAPVILDENMCNAAMGRSIHMVSYDYLSHSYQGTDQPAFMAKRYGFQYSGEIIGLRTYETSLTNMISQFKDSKDHYGILRALSNKKVGIGFIPDQYNTVTVTVIFSK